MTAAEFIELLRERPEAITWDDASSLAREYPFFTLPWALLLQRDNDQRCLADDQRAEAMRRLALNAGDPQRLMMLVDRDHGLWECFYPPEPVAQKSTEEAIDTFLDTYGHTTPKEEELLERLIFNPVPDYGQLLEQEAEQTPVDTAPTGDEQTDMINSFIAGQAEREEVASRPLEESPAPAAVAVAPKAAKKERKPRKDAATPPPAETGTLTESLAKIYIRQRKYDKAYEMIEALSIKRPDKSRYYADQLRFLKKLMIINSKIS